MKNRMKTLANCSPVEFFVQTNKIRKSVDKWLTLTKVMEIRCRAPIFTDGMTDEEQKEEVQKQIKKNLTAMLDSILEEHPKETAELLGLLCFVEPEDLENHTMFEFMGATAELINNPEVISFFTSLARLENMIGLDMEKA